MEYVILLLALLVFVLGLRGSAGLLAAIKDVEQRQRLLGRIAGFLAMSAWLHALPSILAVVYMRHEGILAAEFLKNEDARDTVVALYAIPLVVALTLAASWGALVSFATARPWTLRSPYTLGGMGVAIVALWLLASEYVGLGRGIFILALVAPLSMYLTTTLITPLSTQIRLFWMPFALVAAVTLVLVIDSQGTHKMVANELEQFGIGGGKWIVAKHRDFSLEGRLILSTEHAIYIRAMNDFRSPSSCIIKLPAEDTVFATTTPNPMEPVLSMLPKRFRPLPRLFDFPTFADEMAKHGRAASEATQRFCGTREISPDEIEKVQSRVKQIGELSLWDRLLLYQEVTAPWISRMLNLPRSSIELSTPDESAAPAEGAASGSIPSPSRSK